MEQNPLLQLLAEDLECCWDGTCPDNPDCDPFGNAISTPSPVKRAGNLTVFASNRQSPDQHPIQLDFHFVRGSQGVTHWHGLLRGHALFLDAPRLVLDFNSRDSLAATLEYVEEKTEADQVFVNFHKSRRDRGELLRAFGFLGFELVRPDHPGLPPWEDTLFMVYPMEREPCPEKEQETLKTSLLKGQDEATLLDSLLE